MAGCRDSCAGGGWGVHATCPRRTANGKRAKRTHCVLRTRRRRPLVCARRYRAALSCDSGAPAAAEAAVAEMRALEAAMQVCRSCCCCSSAVRLVDFAGLCVRRGAGEDSRRRIARRGSARQARGAARVRRVLTRRGARSVALTDARAGRPGAQVEAACRAAARHHAARLETVHSRPCTCACTFICQKYDCLSSGTRPSCAARAVHNPAILCRDPGAAPPRKDCA